MKLSKALFIIVFAVILCVPLMALEVTTEFQMGNLGFADDRDSTATDFPLVFPWGLSIYGSQQITELLRIDTGFFYDPVLRNISYTLLQYAQNFFTLGVGPFFGYFNSSSTLLQPGISTAIRIDYPGLAFLEFRADSTIGGRLVKEGDYLQARSDISVGIYVLNAIVTANLFTKSYTYRSSAEEIVDDLVEYSFQTDIYRKNVPIKVLLSFAYQQRGKSFTNVTTNAEVSHELNSLILGTRVDIQLTDFLSFMLNLDSSVYSWGSAGDALLVLPTTGINSFLFNASTGISINIDRLVANRNIN
jgi:hypothetical protein